MNRDIRYDPVAVMKCYAVAMDNSKNLNAGTLKHLSERIFETMDEINTSESIDELEKEKASEIYSRIFEKLCVISALTKHLQ